MLNWLKNTIGGGADALAAEYARYNSREDAEAIVAVMTGVALVEGGMDQSERAKLLGSFAIHPVLKLHSPKALYDKVQVICAAWDMDLILGKEAVFAEVRDVLRKSPDRDRFLGILRMGVASARADGEISDAEKRFLGEVASLAGVTLAEVGL